MGNRAVYCLKEDRKETHFYAHYGANSLSPLLRLWQAMEIQKQLPGNQSLAHIFEHLDYDGGYQEERLPDGDMFFAGIEPGEVGAYEDTYTPARSPVPPVPATPGICGAVPPPAGIPDIQKAAYWHGHPPASPQDRCCYDRQQAAC